MIRDGVPAAKIVQVNIQYDLSVPGQVPGFARPIIIGGQIRDSFMEEGMRSAAYLYSMFDYRTFAESRTDCGKFTSGFKLAPSRINEIDISDNAAKDSRENKSGYRQLTEGKPAIEFQYCRITLFFWINGLGKLERRGHVIVSIDVNQIRCTGKIPFKSGFMPEIKGFMMLVEAKNWEILFPGHPLPLIKQSRVIKYPLTGACTGERMQSHLISRREFGSRMQ